MTKKVLSVLKITATVVVVLLAGAAIEAADPTEKSPEAGNEASTAIDAAAVSRYTPMDIYGVQVFIDSKTGLMRTPTPEEAAALSAELRNRFAGVAPRTKAQTTPLAHADGTVSVELDPSLFNFSVARIQPHGEVKFECTKGHDHASELIAGSPAGPETE